jgi:hypothetical protein
MRTVQSSHASSSGHRRPEQKPGAPSMKRPRGGGRTREGPRQAHPWLRWVPVPLAALAAVIGLLVMGTFQGQVAAANASHPGYRAGGLNLSVNTMLWMSNDMSGLGPVGKHRRGFSMAQSMMPGMQSIGDDRLRVEVVLNNNTGDVQRYSVNDFSLAGTGSKTWPVDSVGHEDMPASAVIQSGFAVTVDLYFDVPAKYINHLTVEWSRGGTTVSIPVRTSNVQPGPMHM